MDGRHQEQPLAARALEISDLQDDRDGFDDEHAADDGEQEGLTHQASHRAEGAAEAERADVAHVDLRRRRVMPEEHEAAAEERGAEDRELAGSRDVADAQVGGELRVACEVGHHAEDGGRDEHAADGEAVQAVGEVHGVRAADADEDEERARDGEAGGERPAERTGGPQRLLEDGEPDLGEPFAVGGVEQHDAKGGERHETLARELEAGGDAVGTAVADLEPVVIEPDEAHADEAPERGEDEDARTRPEEHGGDGRGGDDQPTHGRDLAAFLGELTHQGLGTLGLTQAREHADQPAGEKHAQQEGRDAGEDRADADVVEEAERPPGVDEFAETVKHPSGRKARRAGEEAGSVRARTSGCP